jgi:hypothetical protein
VVNPRRLRALAAAVLSVPTACPAGRARVHCSRSICLGAQVHHRCRAASERAAGRDVARAAVGGAHERALEENAHERLGPRFDLLRIFVGVVRERAQSRAGLGRGLSPSVVQSTRAGQGSSLAFEQSVMNHRYVFSASTVQFVAQLCDSSAARGQCDSARVGAHALTHQIGLAMALTEA